MKNLNRKLIAAMGCYLILMLVAAFKLDGWLRMAVVFFLVVLAVKTIAHANQDKEE